MLVELSFNQPEILWFLRVNSADFAGCYLRGVGDRFDHLLSETTTRSWHLKSGYGSNNLFSMDSYTLFIDLL